MRELNPSNLPKSHGVLGAAFSEGITHRHIGTYQMRASGKQTLQQFICSTRPVLLVLDPRIWRKVPVTNKRLSDHKCAWAPRIAAQC
jgi:hypothetical protein